MERESAEQNLLPEPGPEYTDGKIVLKFTLTHSIKLKRTFRSKNPVTVSVSQTRLQWFHCSDSSFLRTIPFLGCISVFTRSERVGGQEVFSARRCEHIEP